MSKIITPWEGELYLMDCLFENKTQVNFTLRLFSNDIQPSQANTYSSYTHMTTGSGGNPSAITLTLGTWTATTGSAGVDTYASYAEQDLVFTAGAGGTCYGYYITVLDTTNKAVFVERFDNPQAVFDGLTISITPKIKITTHTFT
jgi:hypothetical protein